MSKTIISAKRHPLSVNLKELFQYRELLWMLAWRDFRVQYAQTAIGIAWAVINPLFTIILLSFVFGTVAKVDTGSTPHLLFTVAGMSGWNYFANVVSQAGNSIINAQQMVQKIYFPRLVLPLSKALTALIDYGVILICLLGLIIYYDYPIEMHILYFPLFLLLTIIAGLAGGIWISALTIRFRDFRHIVPWLVRIGLYATPVAYPIAAVPQHYQWIYYLNPISGLIEGVRWSIIGGIPPDPKIYISLSIVVFLFFTGLYYFNKVERDIADLI